MMKYQFIDNHRHEFPVTRGCGALKVKASGYLCLAQTTAKPESPGECQTQKNS